MLAVGVIGLMGVWLKTPESIVFRSEDARITLKMTRGSVFLAVKSTSRVKDLRLDCKAQPLCGAISWIKYSAKNPAAWSARVGVIQARGVGQAFKVSFDGKKLTVAPAILTYRYAARNAEPNTINARLISVRNFGPEHDPSFLLVDGNHFQRYSMWSDGRFFGLLEKGKLMLPIEALRSVSEKNNEIVLVFAKKNQLVTQRVRLK